jgi:hypothetical protein
MRLLRLATAKEKVPPALLSTSTRSRKKGSTLELIPAGSRETVLTEKARAASKLKPKLIEKKEQGKARSRVVAGCVVANSSCDDDQGVSPRTATPFQHTLLASALTARSTHVRQAMCSNSQ